LLAGTLAFLPLPPFSSATNSTSSSTSLGQRRGQHGPPSASPLPSPRRCRSSKAHYLMAHKHACTHMHKWQYMQRIDDVNTQYTRNLLRITLQLRSCSHAEEEERR
jgi:hypothetical protein